MKGTGFCNAKIYKYRFDTEKGITIMVKYIVRKYAKTKQLSIVLT